MDTAAGGLILKMLHCLSGAEEFCNTLELLNVLLQELNLALIISGYRKYMLPWLVYILPFYISLFFEIWDKQKKGGKDNQYSTFIIILSTKAYDLLTAVWKLFLMTARIML